MPRMDTNGNGGNGVAPRRQSRPSRSSAHPPASVEAVERIIRLTNEDAPLNDLLEGANGIARLTEACPVFPISLTTGDQLANVDLPTIRSSAERDQREGPLRTALNDGLIVHITVNNRRQVTFHSIASELRKTLQGTKVLLCGIEFTFPREDPLRDTVFFDVMGFNAKYSTRELFVALHRAKCKPIAILGHRPDTSSKLRASNVRVHVAATSFPDFLMVNGNAIDQLHFHGSFFPIRCRGIPKVTLANVFRERSQHCLDLDAHESTIPIVDEAQPSTNPPTTETDEESGAEPTSTPDGEDAASLNDTASQRSRIDSEVSSDSDLDSLESNTPAADSPLLDLSTSIIDFDVQPDEESQTAGSNVIDDVVMLSAKDEEEFLAIQRGSKRSKVMVQPSPVPTSNRFAAFEDLHVELEIEEWRLQNIGETTPLRVAIKPVVKIPDAIAPDARSYVMPTTVKPSATETELSYSDPMPLADICEDIRRCLREASKLSSIQQSDASLRNASIARRALMVYADPSVLVEDIKRQPLAHTLAFTSELQQNPSVFNELIRLHTIHRCLAASDGNKVRDFMDRTAHYLGIKTLCERQLIIKVFQHLVEGTGKQQRECLHLNDTLALFELLFMLIAPDFYFNPTILSAYLKSPVTWLPTPGTKLLHPLTLIQTLTTDLGRSITDYFNQIQPESNGVSQLTALRTNTMFLASVVNGPISLKIVNDGERCMLDATAEDPMSPVPRN